MRQWQGSSARWHIGYDYPPSGAGRVPSVIERVTGATGVSAARSWPGMRLAEEQARAEARADLRAFAWLLLGLAMCVALGLAWCWVGVLLTQGWLGR